MVQKDKLGRLFLIPCPLGEEGLHTIPTYVVQQLHQLDHFVVERAKTARRFIKSTNPERPISALQIVELDKHDQHRTPEEFSLFLQQGHDVGLISEAGCPGVADPGAEVVKKAHELGAEVVPLVGPSSILLAVMASGMNGQQFCFQGYLSPKKPDLAKDLKRLEQLAQRHDQTQVFIETPYRNQALIEQALKVLQPNTLFGISANLTLPTAYIRTLPIAKWKKTQIPDLHKQPAIFLIYKG